MMRLGSFRPESAASKYLNYETTLVLNKMPEFSKNRVKTYARLMSAKPELIHGAREFRKYVNQPTLNQTTSGIDKSMLNKSLLDVRMQSLSIESRSENKRRICKPSHCFK